MKRIDFIQTVITGSPVFHEVEDRSDYDVIAEFLGKCVKHHNGEKFTDDEVRRLYEGLKEVRVKEVRDA